MSRILLTGSSGFIGSTFISFLKNNYHDFYNKMLILGSKKHSDIETIIYSNHDNLPSLSDYDIKLVIHLGAFTPKSGSEANDINRCNSNIIFTNALLLKLPDTVKKVVFASSIDVYSACNGLLDENYETNPETLYGDSKLYCEKMIRQWSLQKGSLYQILRLGHIYGPGEDAYKKLIPTFIRSIIANTAPVITSSGLEKRSFLHVIDCCRAIFQATYLNTSYDIINIVSNKSYSVKEIADLIINISGKNLQCTIENTNKLTKDLLFNSVKMNKLLCSESIPLELGLKDEYKYFLEQNK